MVAPFTSRVVNRPGIGGFRGVSGASPSVIYANAGGAGNTGPRGSATMTFFTVFRPYSFAAFTAAAPAQQGLFGRLSLTAGASGWIHYYNASQWIALVTNGAGGNVSHNIVSGSQVLIERAVVMITTLAGGNLNSWSSAGGLVGPTACVGYTPSIDARVVAIGNDATLTRPMLGTDIYDCGMMQNYDATGYNSALYGAGLAGFGAQIIDEVENGRDITWPTAAVVNTDFYWTAKDIADPIGKATWTDRISSIGLTRTGMPSSSSTPPRF